MVTQCRKLARLTETTKSVTPQVPSHNPPETKPQLVCYSCGKVGFVRSNCPACRSTSTAAHALETEYLCQSFDTNAQKRSMIEMEVYGLTGFPMVDTGAD